MHPNQLKTTGAYGLYACGQALAVKSGCVWRGSKRAFSRRMREELPHVFRHLGQKGAWSFEAFCVPKLVRDRRSFGAGEGASLDGRREDRLTLVPGRPSVSLHPQMGPGSYKQSIPTP
ncbi:MAG: hypothetical protein KKB50_13385 [Planctomycetes bacterium]|nr:hypothetical protein [Planctomycetota bacterium]